MELAAFKEIKNLLPRHGGSVMIIINYSMCIYKCIVDNDNKYFGIG